MSDDSKEQIIRIVIDDAAAVRQSTAFHQGERKRIKDTSAAAQAATDNDDKAYVRAVKRKANALNALIKESKTALAKQRKAEEDEQAASEKSYVRAQRRKANALNALINESKTALAKQRKAEEDEQAASEKSYVRAVKRKANALNALINESETALAKQRKAEEDEQAASEKSYVRAVKRKANALNALINESKTALAKQRKAEEDEQAASEKSYVRAQRRKANALNALIKESKTALAKQRKAEEDEQAASEKSYVRAQRRKANALNALIKESKTALAKQRKAEEDADQKASKDAESAHDRQYNSIMANVKALALYTAGMVGLHSASQILGEIATKWDDIRKAKIRANEGIIDSADKMRQLAEMEGNAGMPSKTLAKQLAFRDATLLKEDAALSFSVAAESSGFGAVKAGLISRQEFDKLKVIEGKRAQFLGGDTHAMGGVTGLLPSISGQKNNTAAGLASLSDRLNEERRLGGFESQGQFSKQLSDISPYVTKGVYNAPMAGALLSALAINNQGDTAAERLAQATRAVSTNVVRNRGMKISDDYKQDYTKSADFFKKIGVNLDTPPEERILKVTQWLAQREKDRVAAGKSFNAIDELGMVGFTNMEDREALAQFSGAERTGQLQQLVNLGRANLAPSTIEAQHAESMADPANARARAELQAERKSQSVAFGGGLGVFQQRAMENAFAKMGGEVGFGKSLQEIQNPAWWDIKEWAVQNRSSLEWEAQHDTLRRAAKAGMNINTDRIDAKSGEKVGEDWLGWQKLFEIDQQSNAKLGGGMAPAASMDETAKNTKDIKEGIDRLTAAVERRIPAPAGPAPVLAAPPMPGAAPRGGP